MTDWDRRRELRLRRAVREADGAEAAFGWLGVQILLVACVAGLAAKSVWVTLGLIVVLLLASVPLGVRRVVAALLALLWLSFVARLGHGLYVMEEPVSGSGAAHVVGILVCLFLVANDIVVSSRTLNEEMAE